MPRKKKTPSTAEAGEVSVPLFRSPFLLPDEAPRIPKQLPSPAAHYLELAADVVSERRQATRRIKELEEELRADNAKLEKIKRRREGMALASVKDHKDLLAPSTLMCKQTELAQLRARSRDLPTQEAEYRDRAARWGRLESDPEAFAPELLSNSDFVDPEAFAMVCHLAQTHPDAVQVLGGYVIRFLTPLINAATEGSGAAAEELARIASFATRTVCQLCRERPTLFQGLASKALDWPVMLSRKRNFHRDPYQLLDVLQQGAKSPVRVEPGSNWNRHDDTGKVAWSLWEYVADCRELARAAKAAGSWNIKLDEFLDLAGDLDEFCEETWERWWNLAKVALKEAYPDPACSDSLGDIGRPKRNDGVVRRLSPSELRRAIFRELRARFQSFGGAHKAT